MPSRCVDCILFCTLVFVVVAGCKPHEAVYPTDRNLGTEDNPLLPIPLSLIYDGNLLKGRAQDPDLSQLVAPPKSEEEFTDKDVAAIKAIVANMLGSIGNEKWDDLPSFFIPTQAEQLAKFVPIVEKLVNKSLELQKAIAQQMGGPGMMPTDLKSTIAMLQPILMMGMRIEESDAQHADLVVPPPPMMPGAESFSIPFIKVDGEWKIEIPDFPPAQVLDQLFSTIEGLSPGVFEKMDQVIAKLADRSMNAMQAQQEIAQAMEPMKAQIEALFGGADDAEPTSEPETELPTDESIGEEEARKNL